MYLRREPSRAILLDDHDEVNKLYDMLIYHFLYTTVYYLVKIDSLSKKNLFLSSRGESLAPLDEYYGFMMKRQRDNEPYLIRLRVSKMVHKWNRLYLRQIQNINRQIECCTVDHKAKLDAKDSDTVAVIGNREQKI